MNQTPDNYGEQLWDIAEDLAAENRRAARKPFCQVLAYLQAFEECTDNLIRFLPKIEKLAVEMALISFFVWGAIHLLLKLHA